MTLKSQISKLMKRIREGNLPSSERIVDVAFSELGYEEGITDKDVIRTEFNERLHAVFAHTLRVLERFEEETYIEGIPNGFIENNPDAFDRAAVLVKDASTVSEGIRLAFKSLFRDLYPQMRMAFLSISQSRKTRGGKDFELQFGRLLDFAGIPYQKVDRRSRTDFMVPNDLTFKSNRPSALVLSAKRTLRERWREAAEELYSLRSPNVYLITADKNVTQGQVDQICKVHNIHLVVWDELKEERFKDEPMVLDYTSLANRVFPAFEARW